MGSNGTGNFLRLEKRIDLDLCGDKTNPLCLRKEEIEFKDTVRDSPAEFMSELEAKRTISLAYCKICVSEWR